MKLSNNSDLILAVLQAAGGEIVGKIRFQKIVYLLEQLGLKSGLPFSYHHYGPYSEELANDIDFSQIIDGSISEEPRTTSNGFTFTAYKLMPAFSSARERVGDLDFINAQNLVSRMKSETSVVIELAATIHWLKEKEKVSDWEAELVRRKTSKATSENISRAKDLLEKVGLSL